MRNIVSLLASTFALLASAAAFAESSIQYHYGNLKVDYESYHGRRRGLTMPVHEFSILDASGELSAGLSNVSSQYAAREGAIADEKRKVREGESLGGTKILNYSWTQVAAQEGDVKRYGLRLASTRSALSMEPITGARASKYSSLGEFYLVGTMSNDVVASGDSYLISENIFFGFRLGFFRDVDQTNTGPVLNDDRKIDSGYFYLPLTYRLGLLLPIGLRLYVEVGLDPLTLARRYLMKADKNLPDDVVVTPSVEFRVHPNVGLGVRSEDYRGSMIQSDKGAVKNPQYRQRMTTAYINFSG